MTPKIKYILEDTPKTPIVDTCFVVLAIIVPILIGVLVGAHFWDSIDVDKKFPFVMGVTVGTMFLMERTLAAVCNYLDI